MERPLVSIIMPVYKSENFIENSILSVKNQTYPHVELICINDCTPDKSFEICKSMSLKYDNIKLFENERNMGQEFTRNRGLDEAKGKYVVFLDSDDTLDLNTIDSLVSVAEYNSVDIVLYGYSAIIDGKDNPILVSNVPDGLYDMKHFSNFMLGELTLPILSCIGTKLYSREFIINNELTFQIKYKYNEDAAFFFEALLKAHNVYFLNKPYYKYFIRSFGSTMSSYRPNMFSSVSKARELIKKLLIKNDIWQDDSKKTDYYQEMFALMLNSFINEVKFGNRKSFVEACKIVRDYSDFEEMIEVLQRTNKMSFIRKIILPFIKKRRWNIVFWLVKLQQII